ncbi:MULTISPECIES: hypothetical protein [unclassified Bradyrhizobium]|jgi:hypothetical protein|uniref:hypothetical protein n=1 Tax=unclassified Bradyrhizobium TaxID=2631580 RepID=UPI001045B97F|nr:MULTISPECIES: hypothetical protein [unclassified Bradyrhizobium]
MTGLIVIGAIVAFLPFLICATGRGGVWKFLCLLCCVLALFGSVSIVGGVVAWILAWVFAGVALSAAHTERRLARMESKSRRGSTPGPFVPDGVESGVPYRVLKNGAIDAMMQGSVVRFANMDRLLDATSGGFLPSANGADSPPGDFGSEERRRWKLNRDLACVIVVAVVVIAIIYLA